MDFIGKVEKDKLGESLTKARYYSVLNDGSVDSSVQEQELVYVSILDDGVPKVKFLSKKTQMQPVYMSQLRKRLKGLVLHHLQTE